jgi:geranylgeranyl diphosphate synthase type II
VDLTAYHREKTAALFAAATAAGAAAAGMGAEPWRLVGENLGLAYQVADDLRDVVSSADELGKPVGQDAAHDRPSAVAELGLDGALARLGELVEGAVAAIPPCTGAERLAALVRGEVRRLLPQTLAGRLG